MNYIYIESQEKAKILHNRVNKFMSCHINIMNDVFFILFLIIIIQQSCCDAINQHLQPILFYDDFISYHIITIFVFFSDYLLLLQILTLKHCDFPCWHHKQLPASWAPSLMPVPALARCAWCA